MLNDRQNHTRVFLIGGGPGDPDLLTIKARDTLARCDVVIYDHLIHPDVLAYAPQAQWLYAGKPAGRPCVSQEQIHRWLIEHARAGRRVARLKGGDPFVFGRGGEEAQALAAAGIAFAVIPGVSAGWAVPAYAGIPLTYRGVAASVAFVTGHEDPSKAGGTLRWEHLAQGVDTLVIFMGGSRLATVVTQLQAHGRSPQTPVAIIRAGTYAQQRTQVATLGTILEQVTRPIPSPALIVVGEVVRLRETLRWCDVDSTMETPFGAFP